MLLPERLGRRNPLCRFFILLFTPPYARGNYIWVPLRGALRNTFAKGRDVVIVRYEISVTKLKRGRKKRYENAAARQKAYRERKKIISGGMSVPKSQSKGDLHFNRNADTWNDSGERRGTRFPAADPISAVPVLADSRSKTTGSNRTLASGEARESTKAVTTVVVSPQKTDSRGGRNLLPAKKPGVVKFGGCFSCH